MGYRNAEHQRESGKRWRDANRDHLRAYYRSYYHRRKAEDPSWADKLRETGRVRQKRWRDENPDAAALISKRALERSIPRRYGMTPEAYLEMLEQQGGVCAVCSNGQKAKGRYRLHIDHDHDTGEIRGLLCGRCNAGLGFFSDNPELVEKALAYLKHG